MLAAFLIFIDSFIVFLCKSVDVYMCRFMSLSAHRGPRRMSEVSLIPTGLGLFLNPDLAGD